MVFTEEGRTPHSSFRLPPERVAQGPTGPGNLGPRHGDGRSPPGAPSVGGPGHAGRVLMPPRKPTDDEEDGRRCGRHNGNDGNRDDGNEDDECDEGDEETEEYGLDENDDDDDDDDASEHLHRRFRPATKSSAEAAEQRGGTCAPSPPAPRDKPVSFRVRHVARDRWVTATVSPSCHVWELVEATVLRCADLLRAGEQAPSAAQTNDGLPRSGDAGRQRRRHSDFVPLGHSTQPAGLPAPTSPRHDLPHVRGRGDHNSGSKSVRTSGHGVGLPSPTLRSWRGFQSLLGSLKKVSHAGSDHGRAGSGETEESMENLRKDYSIFWVNAGHWLDESRMLESYRLVPAVDILELQLRRRFVPVSYTDGHLGDHYAEGHLLRLHRRRGVPRRAADRTESWKRRWFVLRRGRLECHRSEKELRGHADSFDISALVRVTTPGSDDAYHSEGKRTICLLFVDRFDVQPTARSLVVRAETTADFANWTRIFGSVASENLCFSWCPPPSPSSSGSVQQYQDSPSFATELDSDVSSAASGPVAPPVPPRAPSERDGSLREGQGLSGREEGSGNASWSRAPLSSRLWEGEQEDGHSVREAERRENAPAGWAAEERPAGRLLGLVPVTEGASGEAVLRRGVEEVEEVKEEDPHAPAVFDACLHEVVANGFRTAMSREAARLALAGRLA